MDLNKVSLLGRLVADPRARGTATVFRMATDHKVTGQQQAEYHTVATFGPLAIVAAKYLRKGDRILVKGRLRARFWKTASGQRRRTAGIMAQNLIMLGSPKGQPATRNESSVQK